MRTIAQIPARIKYLLVVRDSLASTVADLTADDCFAFTCEAGAFGESHLDTATANALLFAATPAGVQLVGGELFKDLGRQVVVYDPVTHLRLAIFREVQMVDGPTSSGVPDDYDVAQFIKVWSASGVGVYVARTGPGA